MKKISAKELSCNCHWRFVLNGFLVKIKLSYLNYTIDSNSPLIIFTKFRIDLGAFKRRVFIR